MTDATLREMRELQQNYQRAMRVIEQQTSEIRRLQLENAARTVIMRGREPTPCRQTLTEVVSENHGRVLAPTNAVAPSKPITGSMGSRSRASAGKRAYQAQRSLTL